MAIDAYEIQYFYDEFGKPKAQQISNEPHIIYDSQVVLQCIPSETPYRVQINGFTEINMRLDIEEVNQFKVDYVSGILYFHEGIEGNAVNVNYYGRGKKLLYDTRVKLTNEEGNWESTTLKDLEDEIAEKYRATQFPDNNSPTSVKEQNIQTIVAKEGTTIPTKYLKLGTMIVVY